MRMTKTHTVVRIGRAVAVLSSLLCFVGCALLLWNRGRRVEVWSHSGTDVLLVIACDRGAFDLYAVGTSTGGLGRDEIAVHFAGLSYEQSAYVVGRSYDVTVPW